MTSVDRFWIEHWIALNSDRIRGRVLEAQSDLYSSTLGKPDRIDVIHNWNDNPHANVFADLQDAPQIASATYDCLILTQVLQYIPDLSAALETCSRILRVGGTLLATVPGIAPIAEHEDTLYGDFWRFTARGAEYLVRQHFTKVVTHAYGNRAAASAFLFGAPVLPGETVAQERGIQALIGISAIKT